jgi:hypothetical protein
MGQGRGGLLNPEHTAERNGQVNGVPSLYSTPLRLFIRIHCESAEIEGMGKMGKMPFHRSSVLESFHWPFVLLLYSRLYLYLLFQISQAGLFFIQIF